MTPAPYWKLPLASVVVPRQAAFKKNMALLNDELSKAIEQALKGRKVRARVCVVCVCGG